jgi:hypothetical protein
MIELMKGLLVCLSATTFLAIGCTNRVWTPQLPETQPYQAAPAECIAVFGNLMDYIGKAEPDLVNDTEAQNRFLTASLRKALSDRLLELGDSKDRPDFPSNQSFRLVWNPPSTYTIAGSRHYDFRNTNNPNDNRAIIDVLYEWDNWSDGLTNQYPGEKQLLSFIFVFEDGAWKLDDIYVFDDKYTATDSLKLQFQKQ